jgi:hypothetical protein
MDVEIKRLYEENRDLKCILMSLDKLAYGNNRPSTVLYEIVLFYLSCKFILFIHLNDFLKKDE